MLAKILIGFVLALVTYFLLGLLFNSFWSGLVALAVFVFYVFRPEF